MTRQKIHPPCLTIAGSDCSGGAGLEADLKTFAAHGAYGMAAVTCVVAETPGRVLSIHPVPPKSIQQQIACCLQGMGPVAIKTGMLYSAEIIRACRKEIGRQKGRISHLVVDPVMVATSGRRLLHARAIHELKCFITDFATLITPNLDEAGIFVGRPLRTPPEVQVAAWEMARDMKTAVLIKGGHLKTSRSAGDYFWDGSEGFWLRSPWVRGVKTHGTGCTLSAAITAGLAHGLELPKAIQTAKTYVTAAIRHSCRFKPWTALRHHLPD